jgi:hypothetical protein
VIDKLSTYWLSGQMLLVLVPKSSDLVPRLFVSCVHVSLHHRSHSVLTVRIIEVAGFFLLQIGLPVVKHDGWTLFSDAVFQSLSVRASGFSILPITNFAPALL